MRHLDDTAFSLSRREWQERMGMVKEASREQPAANPILLVPALSFTAGLVVLFGGLLISWGARWSGRWVLIAAGGAAIGVLVMFLVMAWCKPILWSRERVQGFDPRQPQPDGRPEIRIEVQTPEKNQVRYLDLPLKSPELAREFARRLAAGYPFSESEWTGAGGMFSKREFRTVRDRMITTGMAAWRNREAPSQGVELTAYGRHVVKEIAGQQDVAGLLEEGE